MAVKSRLPNQFPRDQGLSAESLATLDSMLVQVNTLLGQGSVPPGQGLGAFGTNIIDPTSAQISSGGSRTSAITTGIQAVMTTTTAQFFYDGTNSSQPFKIYRDDGSVFGPFITDSGLLVTGLTPSTNYFFYAYFDETVQRIKFVNIAGVSVGSPGYAFTAQNNLAAQQQILRNHIPIALILATTGASTTGGGTVTVFGGSGGSGSGTGGSGKLLP